MNPADRYQCGAHPVNALDPHLDSDALFHYQLTRSVRLGHQLHEVDLSLRTLTVPLRFDLVKRDRLEISYRGTAFGLAQRVNAQLNCQIEPGDAYETRGSSGILAVGSPVGRQCRAIWRTVFASPAGDTPKSAGPGLAGPMSCGCPASHDLALHLIAAILAPIGGYWETVAAGDNSPPGDHDLARNQFRNQACCAL